MLSKIVLAFALASPLFSLDENPAAAQENEPTLQGEKAKSSYAMGVDLGKKLSLVSPGLDAELVFRGVRDGLSGNKTLLTNEEIKAALAALSSQSRKNQEQLLGQVGEKNKMEGEAFLAANKAKEGVITVESGLQYKILKAGDGKKPSADDTVICQYRGTLLDGTEFDSSFARKRPATFPVSRLIKGWSEALQLMPVGSKWQLFIPAHLAYGEKGPAVRGGVSKIGPNATLIFEVELLSIQTPAVAAAPAEADEGPASIEVSFKLDPRITKSLYMGERWVSPPTYTTTLETVDARVAMVDQKGHTGYATAKWISSDPEMVKVSPSEGEEVQIAVLRAGETTLNVSAGGVSKQFSVKASRQNNAMQVQIAQK